MASNFSIVIQRKKRGFQFELRGDFDGSSAFELMNTLKSHCSRDEKIVVNTEGLSEIHLFGQRVFQKHCSISNLPGGVIFTGKHGYSIMPERSVSV